MCLTNSGGLWDIVWIFKLDTIQVIFTGVYPYRDYIQQEFTVMSKNKIQSKLLYLFMMTLSFGVLRNFIEKLKRIYLSKDGLVLLKVF